MTIKPRKPNIRRADPPGPKMAHRTPDPEQPVKPSGHPVRQPATYEQLQAYAHAAEKKLGDFKKLVEDVYQILGRPDDARFQSAEEELADRCVAARARLAEFDRRLPKVPG